jgi:hypothetical protein
MAIFRIEYAEKKQAYWSEQFAITHWRSVSISNINKNKIRRR